MFIGITGTHGTGKTTLLYKLAHDMKIRHGQKSIKVISEVARSCPLTYFKNESRSSEEAQLWIFCAQIKAELEARQKFDIILSDRTIYDVIGYTMEVNEDLAAEMFGFARLLQYDLLYFVRPTNPEWARADGGRSIDMKLRNKVDANLQKIISSKELNVKEVKIWQV